MIHRIPPTVTFSIKSRESAPTALIKPRNVRSSQSPTPLRVTRERILARNQAMDIAEQITTPAEIVGTEFQSASIGVQEKGDGTARFQGFESRFEHGRTGIHIPDIPPLCDLYSTRAQTCMPTMSPHCEPNNSIIEPNSYDGAIAPPPTSTTYRLPGLPNIVGEPLESSLFGENSLAPLLSSAPTSILGAAGLHSTPLITASTPGGTGRGRIFDGLVEDILQHPSFPLMFEGTYKSSTGIPPNIDDIRTQAALRRASEKSREIESNARAMGVQDALKRANSIDFFFCLLHAAFKSLQSEMQPPIPSSLHTTMNACAKLPDDVWMRGSEGSPIESPILDSTADDSTRSKLSKHARNRLEEWFIEHFNNPYPTKEEKIMLAQECELTIGQVSDVY